MDKMRSILCPRTHLEHLKNDLEVYFNRIVDRSTRHVPDLSSLSACHHEKFYMEDHFLMEQCQKSMNQALCDVEHISRVLFHFTRMYFVV